MRDNHPGLFGWAPLEEGRHGARRGTELKTIAARLRKAISGIEFRASASTVTLLLENQVGEYRASLTLLFVAVGVVLAHRLRESRQSARGARGGAGA